jgi:Tfp pilus assembly protein PilO
MIRTITPIFSIVIAVVVFMFFTKPMFAEIKSLQGKTEQYEDAANKAQELNAALAEKLSNKRSYSTENLERLNALVPESINEVTVLTDLNELARTHNMLFGNINVEEEDTTEVDVDPGKAISQTISYHDITSTSLSFSLIGTYDQFKAFLADVERSLVMMEVVEIEFMAGEGNLQQFEVTVNLFALPPIE